MMDVENRTSLASTEELDKSVEKLESEDDDIEEILPPPVTPTGKSPCAPQNGHSVSPTTPSTGSKKRKRLSTKEREEREKERAEKRAKIEEERQRKEEEKQRREEERLAKLAVKEEERRRKEEERVQREEEKKKKLEEAEKLRKQKEEEKRKKQEEEERKKREKEEEKKQKEEERKKKHEEEERRKKEKEEERLKKLEEKDREKKKEEDKRAKQAKLFTSFFQKSPSAAKTPKRITPTLVSDAKKDGTSATSSQDETKNPHAFCPMMFEVKSNMALAPTCRRKLTQKDINTFDKQVLQERNPESKGIGTEFNYLTSIKKSRGRKSTRTDLLADPDVEIIARNVIENPKEQGLVKWRYKLLHFHDNQRPAYWGTWKKIPLIVKGRRPFSQEKEIDYDFDSDDEWEQEPEDAEDLAADSDKEDDPENADSEEDDEDGWLVPHGYISDDEGSKDEHLDKEALKSVEKDYFEGLKKQIKIQLPEIQTARLGDFRIIFSPLRKKWKETCAKAAATLATSAAIAQANAPEIVKVP